MGEKIMDSSLPPLILEGVDRVVSLLELWDAETQKLALNIDHTIYYAHHGGIEDIIVTATTESETHPVFEHILSRNRKSYKHTRFHLVKVPLSAGTGVNAVRHVEATLGNSLFAKGFIYLSAKVVLTSTENLLSLWAHHQSKKKKCLMTLSTYRGVKRGVRNPDAGVRKDTAEPGKRCCYVLSDEKTTEVVAFYCYNGCQPVDIKTYLRGNNNLRNNPPETIIVDSNLESPCIFAATSGFLQHLRDNFDFHSWTEVIDSILSSEIKAEGTIHLHKQAKKFFDLSSFKSVFDYLSRYQTSLSGAVWDYDATNGLVSHFTARYQASVKLRNTLLMNDVTIDVDTIISNAVILPGSSVGRNCNLIYAIVDGAIENGVVIQGPALITTRLNDIKPHWQQDLRQNNLSIYRHQKEMEPDVLESEFPNQENLSKMIDFPMDQDKIYDLLFEDSSSESSCGAMGTPSQPENKAADTEFVEEIQGMLLSVVARPSHLKNFELELRTFRLSAFKTRKVVLQAVLPIILAGAVQLHPNLTNESFEWQVAVDFFEEAEMEFLLDSLVDDEIESYDIIYRGFCEFCTRDWIPKIVFGEEARPDIKIPNIAKGSPIMFHRFCMMLETLDHETYLNAWFQKHQSDPELSCHLQHPVLEKYIRSLE